MNISKVQWEIMHALSRQCCQEAVCQISLQLTLIAEDIEGCKVSCFLRHSVVAACCVTCDVMCCDVT